MCAHPHIVGKFDIFKKRVKSKQKEEKKHRSKDIA